MTDKPERLPRYAHLWRELRRWLEDNAYAKGEHEAGAIYRQVYTIMSEMERRTKPTTGGA